MSHPLFEQHRATLDGALAALATRGYWSPYPEMPSPKVYGEGAQDAARADVLALAGHRFELDQPGVRGWLATEHSPYGVPLEIAYPVAAEDALIAAAVAARPAWTRAGIEGRTGVCLEILARLNRASMQIAHAVMLTTGQGWMMAFQAGGPHAQDRGLEALAWAWREMSFVPGQARWDKPQGKNPPLVMDKHFEVVGRGVALVIGCATFPTWNTYPGLFAALATGNPVLVKPHPAAVLPAALTVRIAREVLREQGLPPDTVQLAHVDDPETTRRLATRPEVASIDFTGGSAFGRWLLEHAGGRQVYAELSGVNVVAIESTDDYRGMLRNLAFTLSLYSGQMCTTTKVLLVPAEGIDTDQGRKGCDEVATDLGAAIERLLADPATACAILGCIQSPDTLQRIAEASAAPSVVLASRRIPHPDYPAAEVRSPVLLRADAAQAEAYRHERFGPIATVVRVPGDAAALAALCGEIVAGCGALTVGLYTRHESVVERFAATTVDAGVALSINLTGAVYVNQSAAFSDFHATGANPAANATYADAAFVANRFRVIQRRRHAPAPTATA